MQRLLRQIIDPRLPYVWGAAADVAWALRARRAAGRLVPRGDDVKMEWVRCTGARTGPAGASPGWRGYPLSRLLPVCTEAAALHQHQGQLAMAKSGIRTLTRVITLLVAVCALTFSDVGSAFSFKDLFGGSAKKDSAAAATAVPAAPSSGDAQAAEVTAAASPDGPDKLTFGDVERLVEVLSPAQRTALLGNADSFKHFVAQEEANRSLLQAARANKLDQDPEISFLMERGAERVLTEIYLNRLLHKNMPAGYPSEKEMKAFYDKNKSKFQLGERMHMWQIYLPLTKDADAKTRARVEREANDIVSALRRGKMDFADAAAKYSQHQPSRLNGGYMGLLKVSDLLPEIRNAAKGLKEGQISKPLQTADGIHIIKRGGILPARQLDYAEVKDEVRQIMLREAELQIRKAVVEKVTKTYPVKPETPDIDAWRSKLRAAIARSAEKKNASKGH